MVDYTQEFDIVWHGAMQNDPLGSGTKGCLLPPREQSEEERFRSMPLTDLFDCDLSLEELRAGVERLRLSLKNPDAVRGMPDVCLNQKGNRGGYTRRVA